VKVEPTSFTAIRKLHPLSIFNSATAERLAAFASHSFPKATKHDSTVTGLLDLFQYSQNPGQCPVDMAYSYTQPVALVISSTSTDNNEAD